MIDLKIFKTANLFEAATNLFLQLGIKLNSNTTEPLPIKDLLKQQYKDNDTFNSVDRVFFIGIIDDSVFKATGMFDVNYSYKEALQQGDKNYEGLMLFALDTKKQPTRTEISELTRSFNRISQKMPVALVLKYKIEKEIAISIAISERFKYQQNWRQGEKTGKVIILRDIHTETTHAGHERILLDLVKPVGVTAFGQLHERWLQVLDVSILNKRFFQELANWYFWAMDNVHFPDDLEKKKDVRNAVNLIRLITRVIFIWFIKEKALVPNALFNRAYLNKILKDFNKNKKAQNYYNAILQNLFFGTLNQKMDERKFAKEGDIKVNKEEYGVKNLFRYSDLFTISEKEVLSLFKDVPFLNGGLFDCLDKPNDENKIVYVDGFSRNPKKQAGVPDYVFFGEEREVDLNEIYGTRNKTYKSKGLISLLESYKFTIAENTPLEEEVALDPELLGKVFENLLASYNPETQTTARKQTGSFYTPREIVNYMVDESLFEYLSQNTKNRISDFEKRLRNLFSYSENANPFNEQESKELIEAINICKILDPACGSGAFPMGILHKMVHILQKLDPENKLWKALQRKKAIEETETAFNIGDKEERAKRLTEINDVFENNASDYGRKLYLIENCIYGIDIQPIAVQIAKLRFFISLVIDQKVNRNKDNFGVRSLPNLETKFVAANTIIGLDKPQQTLLRNPNIEVKENELKGLRHKYFTANTRKEKIQYQKQDKKLRQEIARMLEKDGWETKVAKQIVAFDPYDQNTYADWFDPEWMFGLKDSVSEGVFDIVIGNPPYISYYSNTGSSLTKEEKKYFLENYHSVLKLNDRINSMNLMTEKGLRILKPLGHLSFITNKTIAVLPSYVEVRRFILSSAKISYIVTDLYPFEAIVDCVVFGLRREVAQDYDLRWYKGEVDNYEIKNSSLFSSNAKLEFHFSAHQNILKKIDQAENTLQDLLTINRGVNIGGCFDEFLSETKKSDQYWKYLAGTRNINRYFFKWFEEDGYMIFDAKLEQKLRNQGETLVLGNHDRYKQERLFIPESGQYLMAAYCNEKYYSAYGVMVGTNANSSYSIKYSCALLNSKLFTFYAEEKEILRKGNKATPHVGVKGLNSIPVYLCKKEVESKICCIVDYCTFLKSKNEIQYSSYFERLIDAIVYELYFSESIKAAGAEVLSHLTNVAELKEDQDERNLKTLEKTYKELSDPKHPLSAALLKLLTIEEINIIEGRK